MERDHVGSLRVAVLIPCYNEAATIQKVVEEFRSALPEATIHVCNNNSTDDTAARAAAAGASVCLERLPGKGNAVRRLFADVDADAYVLVDGDDTYAADDAPRLVAALLEQGLDLVNGSRQPLSDNVYPPGHRFGNWLLSSIVAWVFGRGVRDMLSGYKVFSRRFVKSFPAMAVGFEIETELIVHALELRMPVAEFDTTYRNRPRGSTSKLSTVRDGWRILSTIIVLIKDERPLQVFSAVFAVLAAAAILLALPIATEFVRTGLVPRLPTAVLSTGMMLLAFLSLACGLVLDTVTHGRREMKRLHYLTVPIVGLTSPSSGGPPAGGDGIAVESRPYAVIDRR
jgi:hypothetical protein